MIPIVEVRDRAAVTVNDEAVQALYGGDRQWFDIVTQDFVRMTTLYVPYGNEHGGCPDWRGRWKGGDITKMPCVFCALPNAVRDFQKGFYNGASVPHTHLVDMLSQNIARAQAKGAMHTLAIFNGGSFLAMEPALQIDIAQCVAQANVARLVIESRAGLVTHEAVKRLMNVLAPHNIKLTIRIGVETQDDRVRLKVLIKGHTRKALASATRIAHEYGVTVGGYALVAPAPHSWILRVCPEARNYEAWMLAEGVATVDAILGEFGMDEVYLCSTCVAPNTLLEKLWREGEYKPASLTLVAEVLAQSGRLQHTKPIHLLPLKDEPAFVAVSSNHEPGGVHQNEKVLHDHDVRFRMLLDFYRKTLSVQAFLNVYTLLKKEVEGCSCCSFKFN